MTLTGIVCRRRSDILLNYVDSGADGADGAAESDGGGGGRNSATLVVPPYANGVTTLSLLGSSTSQTLQIVPTLTSYVVGRNQHAAAVRHRLQEGSAGNTVTYNFAGGTGHRHGGQFRR